MDSIAIPALPELCFGAVPPASHWVQYDIALVRIAGDARPSAARLFAAAVPWWESQSRLGHVTQWFFMRKPPDVRLRFLVTAQARPALREFESTLLSAVTAGHIAGAARGDYTPETERFGGSAAMVHVHALFTLDTTLWWHLAELEACGRRVVTSDCLLAAIIQDLFESCDRHEVRDAWQRLARHVLLDSAPASAADAEPSSLEALARAPGLSEQEGAIIAAYRSGHARLAAALRSGSTLSTLSCPVVETAATAAFFMLNRHGFPGERSRPLVAQAISALSPQP